MEVRRRYSSSTMLEDSLSTELHFVYLSEDESHSSVPPHHASGSNNNGAGGNALLDDSKSSSEEDEQSVAAAVEVPARQEPLAPPRPVASPKGAAMSREDKERHIEQTLEQWGVPKRELRRGSAEKLETSAERIKSAVTEWAGSPTRLKGARAAEKQAEKQKQERVRVVVAHWAEGPPFLRACIDEMQTEALASPKPRVGSGRRPPIDVQRVLRGVRACGVPTAADISRMASATVVKGSAGLAGPMAVLRCLALSLNDPRSHELLLQSQDVAASLRLLPPESPTMRVARVLARATVAPLDLAMKDACPYVFNSVKHSWAVRVEIFEHVVVVTHARTECSAPGHDAMFVFSWAASLVLQRGPDGDNVGELFLELTQVEAEEPRVAERVQDLFRRA